MSYVIKRFYGHGFSRTIKRVATLKEAQEHCRDPQTCSHTKTTPKTGNRTKSLERKHKENPWFDGYLEVS